MIAAPEAYQGKRVSQILFDPPLQPLPDSELEEMLPVKKGEPLDLRKVREAIVRLYATGRYQDIAADAEMNNGDIVIRFLTRTTWFVGRVSVEGVPEPPNRGQLINATRLQLGAEFSEEQSTTAIDRLLEMLRRDGFYEAKVERFLEYEPAFAQVNAVFRVDPGPRARFNTPVIEGVTREEAQNVIGATKWERFWFLPGWKNITENNVQQGLERVRDKYQDRDLLLHRVTLEGIRYEPETRTAIPTLKIIPGPQVRIRTSGADISQRTVRRLVPVYQEQSVDRDLLVEGSRNLTQHLQGKGYFDSKVDFKVTDYNDQVATIEYRVAPGPRHKLVRVDIEGNRYFNDETLRERLSITPATLIRYRNGRFSEAMLESDLEAIRVLYRSNGFLDVQVTARIETPDPARREEVAVSISVEEGQQWMLSELTLEGASEQHEPRVRSLLGLDVGQPFSETAVAADRDNVLDYYYNRGYLEAAFDWTSEVDADSRQAKLHVRVTEGPQRIVRATILGGLEVTDPDLVTGRLRLSPGEPLSQSGLAETQRRLYDLGIFARADTAIQNADGEEKRKYVLHQFEEARRHSVNFGFGAQIGQIGGGETDFDNPAGSTGFSPRVSVGVSRLNMFGLGHTANLQGRASETRQRAVLNYLAPHFKKQENISLNLTGLYDFSKDINTFASTRWEGSTLFNQRLSRANSVRYGFIYRQTNIRDLKISDELVPIFARPARVGLVTATLFQDKRDDPLESHRGIYNAVETGFAWRYFGSQTDYLRLVGRNSSYHRLGRDIVLARSISVGWLANLAENPLERPIPLPELFFSGGASSHRAFPENQAGPRDLETGFVIGGRAVLTHNLELRVPLLGDNLGGVLFHDCGNVYSQMSNLSLRFHQKDPQDFDYMVHGFGLGVRYRTPIGPVRFDLSYSPNSPEFWGFKGSYDDLINGRGERVFQQINPFQFFFSIGQTF